MFAKVPVNEDVDQMEALPQRVETVLTNAKNSGYSSPVVVGAVPFHPARSPHLIVPETVRWSGPLSFASEPLQQTPDYSFDIREVPKSTEFKRGVERALNQFKSDNNLCKVVLSRSLELTTKAKVNIHHLLRHLAANNTDGYTFAVDLPPFESVYEKPDSQRTTLIGATPELLVSKSGLQVVANPLAGSAARCENSIEDQKRGEDLLSSAKDRHEHAVVVSAVKDALGPFCKSIDVPDKPSLLKTSTMWHLSTEIKGEIADPTISSVDLATALHPTPAVCGSPTELARKTIAEIEPFDRQFYTGMVGWCNDYGDGEWVVTIRCAKVSDRLLHLYAGAGIVEDSRAEDELAETSAKFKTMLHALGLGNI
ncbi:isochorismate synthase [Salibacterium salarium]|nr:isochorismate synthase [Salibacterium salarium]